MVPSVAEDRERQEYFAAESVTWAAILESDWQGPVQLELCAPCSPAQHVCR